VPKNWWWVLPSSGKKGWGGGGGGEKAPQKLKITPIRPCMVHCLIYDKDTTPHDLCFLLGNYHTDDEIFKDHKVDRKDLYQGPDNLWVVPVLTIDIQEFILSPTMENDNDNL
jgi:hypothetical protein